MNYPIWIMPFIGGGWVIGIIAIIHVFVSHFAVGGGAFLAVTEHLAWRHNDDRIYQYLKRHSRFFLLVTTVLGVIFGPGIWWSISLVNPNATETLIQNYTLLWAFEYVVFATELATFFCVLLHLGSHSTQAAPEAGLALLWHFNPDFGHH